MYEIKPPIFIRFTLFYIFMIFGRDWPWSYSMRCCMILLVHPPGCHGGTGAAFAAQRADGRIITWGDDPWLRGSQFQSSSENGRQLYLILWSFTAIYILIYGICVGTFWDL
jgi:hypothetical protein